MSTIGITLGLGALLTVAAVGLIVWLVKWSGRRGEDRGAAEERAKRVVEASRRRARAEAARARPIESGADAWLERRYRVQDDGDS